MNRAYSRATRAIAAHVPTPKTPNQKACVQMSSGESERSAAGLTALPTVEQLQRSGDGYDAQAVREAFDAFRRHTAQLQAQLRVLQAARTTANVEPTGHAVRMDSLHLIRAAAEFADTLERDAQTASATQLQRTEEEVRKKQNELQQREAEIERYRAESERQRAEIVTAAKGEARDLLAKTNAARAEVEQTLEWARAQATAVMARAQKGAEQLLAAAGLGEPAISQVVQSIVEANDSEIARATGQSPPRSAPVTAAEPDEEPADEPPVSASPASENAMPEQPDWEPPVSEPPAPPLSPAPAEDESEPER